MSWAGSQTVDDMPEIDHASTVIEASDQWTDNAGLAHKRARCRSQVAAIFWAAVMGEFVIARLRSTAESQRKA
jgi:hypothetical protein